MIDSTTIQRAWDLTKATYSSARNPSVKLARDPDNSDKYWILFFDLNSDEKSDIDRLFSLRRQVRRGLAKEDRLSLSLYFR